MIKIPTYFNSNSDVFSNKLDDSIHQVHVYDTIIDRVTGAKYIRSYARVCGNAWNMWIAEYYSVPKVSEG